MACHGHVFCLAAFTQAGLVVGGGDVQNPMKAVLDIPVATDCLTGPFGIEYGRGDVVSGFRVLFPAPLDAGLDRDDACDTWQAQFTRETAVPRQPIDLSHDAGDTLFDAAMAFVVRGWYGSLSCRVEPC